MTGRTWERDVIDRLSEQPGERLTPRILETIQTALHERLGQFIDNTSYFILGSYGDDERPVLEAVKAELAGVEADAFLMDDIHDVTEFYTSKFKLLLSYADHVVGVYEHSSGGHAWEVGYVDQPEYRSLTQVFYRLHGTEAEQYASYDGMFAHWILSMKRVNRSHSWTRLDELVDAIAATFQ